MVQIWEIDDKNYYTGKMDFVEKPTKLQITKPLLVGYVKPYFNGEDWEEGATQEEINEWNQANKIDICPIPSIDDRINQLEEDKKVLAENVFALAEVLEELLKGGEESGQTNSIDENTEN